MCLLPRIVHRCKRYEVMGCTVWASKTRMCVTYKGIIFRYNEFVVPGVGGAVGRRQGEGSGVEVHVGEGGGCGSATQRKTVCDGNDDGDRSQKCRGIGGTHRWWKAQCEVVSIEGAPNASVDVVRCYSKVTVQEVVGGK